MVSTIEIIEISDSDEEEARSSQDHDGPDKRLHAERHTSGELSTTHCNDTYATCLDAVTELFPDISVDHVHDLYEEHMRSNVALQVDAIVQFITSRILDAGSYPRERDRLRAAKDLKRKRGQGVDVDEEIQKWKSVPTPSNTRLYLQVSKAVLREAFPLVPVSFLCEKLKESGTLFLAFLAVATAEREYSTSSRRPYSRLQSGRSNYAKRPVNDLMLVVQAEGHDHERLQNEIDAASRRKEVDDALHMTYMQEAAEAIAKEQDERDRGNTMECACCFDDVPISQITHCNAENPHFFCHSCARSNAETDIGLHKHVLQCMDGSVCKATFSQAERAKFLNDHIIEKLDEMEQQTAVRVAMESLKDFVTCPFCRYGHICPPVEEDREFRCRYPDCREVSCRICKEKSHTPLDCEQHRRENGISERHVVEEARTDALLRTCPKCKARILKEDGCNKVVCSCSSVLCDFCGKDITSERYKHFNQQVPPFAAANALSKCPLYDVEGDRKEKQIKAAEQTTMAKIRHENPHISNEDLAINFSDQIQQMERQRHLNRHHLVPGHFGVRHPYFAAQPFQAGAAGDEHRRDPVPLLDDTIAINRPMTVRNRVDRASVAANRHQQLRATRTNLQDIHLEQMSEQQKALMSEQQRALEQQQQIHRRERFARFHEAFPTVAEDRMARLPFLNQQLLQGETLHARPLNFYQPAPQLQLPDHTMPAPMQYHSQNGLQGGDVGFQPPRVPVFERGHQGAHAGLFDRFLDHSQGAGNKHSRGRHQ